MKASVKLYTTDGSGEYGFPIKLILYNNVTRKRKRRVIGYAFETDWDSLHNLPTPDHDDFEDLYGRIMDIKKKAAKMEFRDMESFDPAFDYLLGAPKKTKSFYDYAEDRIAYMKKLKRDGNARAYAIAVKELQKYRPQLEFKDISREFLEGFKNYKKAEGCKNTTVRNYLYETRAIYNTAVRSGIIEDARPFVNLFNDIPVRKRRAKNHYLNEDMIRELENAEFRQKNYIIARDLALLQFYFCGLDFVDLVHLKRDQITEDRIYIYRKKLGDRGYEFDVKIFDKARALMEKYEGEDPDYYFYFPKMYHYETWRVRMYRALNQVKKQLKIKLLPKDGTFTLKLMRHSFATLGKFKRVEEDLLRELQGHERNDIDTIYKDKYPEAERDAAQWKIIEL